ncbi:MAG TPA: hypothetical protein PKA64_08485, partial [Myxococcota bacterium]|nr:hypothetical protein [Myxococcota bacterium]
LSPTPPQAPEPGLASADDPFGLPPADGDPWKDLQATPSPPDGTARVNPLHPQQGVIVQPGGPYPADVRGVGQLFRDREADVRDCMSREGPAANPGEVAVMLRLHLKTDPGSPQGGGIERIEAVQDTEGRYQHFLTCAQTALQGAPLQAPSAGTGIVHWSVRR